LRNTISLFLKGIVIGLANIIPGVSGGTMALILGIYDRLIRAGSRFGVSTLGELKTALGSDSKGRALAELGKKYDVLFLTMLVAGAFAAVVAAMPLLLWLLADHPTATYGFFFGLVAASIIVPYSLLTRKSWREFASCLVAIVLTVMLSTAMSGEERVQKEEQKLAMREAEAAPGEEPAVDHSPERLGFLFVVGSAASSAMILPGVSGSFLLLLFGAFEDVLGAIKRMDVLVLAIFATGALIGLALFVKLLEFLMRRFASQTMAFLAGLMIGSLWNLWPFQDRVAVGEKLIGVAHQFPSDLGGETVLTLATILIGGALVVGFHVYGQRNKGEPAVAGAEVSVEVAEETPTEEHST